MMLTRLIGGRCNSRIVIDFLWSNIILLFVTGSYVCGVVLCICFLVLCLFIYLFIVFPVGPRIYKVIPLMMWYVYSRGFGSWVRISHWEFNGTRCLSYLIRSVWEYLEPRGGGLFKLGRISIVRAAALFSLGVTVNPFGNLVDYIVKIVKIYPFDVMTTFL